MVKTKTKGLLSIIYTRNKVYQPPNPPQASFIADDTLFEPSQLSKKQTHIDTTTNITGIKPFTYSLLVGVKR